MRKKEKEITDRQEIESILEHALVMRLAVCDGDAPYIVPVNYGYKDGVVYVHSSRKGMKMDILRKHPKVCFEVDVDAGLLKPADMANPCGFGMRFRSVIGFGTAEIVEDAEGVVEGLHVLMAHYSDETFTFPEKIVDKTAIVKIPVDSMTGKKDGFE